MIWASEIVVSRLYSLVNIPTYSVTPSGRKMLGGSVRRFSLIPHGSEPFSQSCRPTPLSLERSAWQLVSMRLWLIEV
jgi:hypothetical protein